MTTDRTERGLCTEKVVYWSQKLHLPFCYFHRLTGTANHIYCISKLFLTIAERCRTSPCLVHNLLLMLTWGSVWRRLAGGAWIGFGCPRDWSGEAGCRLNRQIHVSCLAANSKYFMERAEVTANWHIAECTARAYLSSCRLHQSCSLRKHRGIRQHPRHIWEQLSYIIIWKSWTGVNSYHSCRRDPHLCDITIWSQHAETVRLIAYILHEGIYSAMIKSTIVYRYTQCRYMLKM